MLLCGSIASVKVDPSAFVLSEQEVALRLQPTSPDAAVESMGASFDRSSSPPGASARQLPTLRGNMRFFAVHVELQSVDSIPPGNHLRRVPGRARTSALAAGLMHSLKYNDKKRDL